MLGVFQLFAPDLVPADPVCWGTGLIFGRIWTLNVF